MLECSLTSVAQSNAVVVGVDAPTAGRLSADDQSKLLNSLHESGVRVIRTWIAEDDLLKKAFVLGIKADLTLCIMYRPDAPKRASVPDMPNTFSRPPLSLADVDRTKSTFEEQLSKLEDLGIDFVAFELGRTIRVSMEQGLARSPKLRHQLTKGGFLRTEGSLSMLNLPLFVRSNFGSRRGSNAYVKS
jgi:hypothetical protein